MSLGAVVNFSDATLLSAAFVIEISVHLSVCLSVTLVIHVESVQDVGAQFLQS